MVWGLELSCELQPSRGNIISAFGFTLDIWKFRIDLERWRLGTNLWCFTVRCSIITCWSTFLFDHIRVLISNCSSSAAIIFSLFLHHDAESTCSRFQKALDWRVWIKCVAITILTQTEEIQLVFCPRWTDCFCHRQPQQPSAHVSARTMTTTNHNTGQSGPSVHHLTYFRYFIPCSRALREKSLAAQITRRAPCTVHSPCSSCTYFLV
jgi:hypothetical protein